MKTLRINENMTSAQILELLRQNSGSYLLDESAAPHTDLKRRVVTLKDTNDNDMQILEGGAAIIDALLRTKQIVEASPDKPWEGYRTYRLAMGDKP